METQSIPISTTNWTRAFDAMGMPIGIYVCRETGETMTEEEMDVLGANTWQEEVPNQDK